MRLSREQRAMLDGIHGSPGGDVMRRQMAVARVFDTAQPVPAHEPLHFCAPAVAHAVAIRNRGWARGFSPEDVAQDEALDDRAAHETHACS